MKTLRKLTAFVLVMAMTLAMSVTVFADNNNGYSITINNATAGHTYEAYQILAGDLSEDGTTLSNITWGSGITVEGQAALEKAAKVNDAVGYAEKLSNIADRSEDAVAVANELGKLLDKPAGSTSTLSDGKYIITGLKPGYYLVKDKDKSLETENLDAYTSFILAVVKSVSVEPKSDVPSSQKKVMDVNDSTGVNTVDTNGNVWIDSADYDFGDEVPFQLTGTLPSNFASYDTYKYVFHDKQSNGLQFLKDTVKVFVVNGNDRTEVDSALYSVLTGDKVKVETDTFEIEFADLKQISGVNAASKIVVEYKSILTTAANVGATGNPNEMRVEFSNNPNGEGTGHTPWDKVIVFTYKVVVNKVDAEQKALAGAEFTLSKVLKDGTLVELSAVKTNEGTVFSFTGLDDGDYVLKETKTPDGYNTIDDIKFTVTAKHDIVSDSPALSELSGNCETGLITFTANLPEGSLTTYVVNNKGSVLPSTGGAGRVLIYVIGAVLVLGAGVVLVSKRRASL